MKLRIIGDIHGDSELHKKFMDCDRSVQIGDLGFNYDYLQDNKNHKGFTGNHDNIPESKNHPFFLGDYGTRVNGTEFFFVRGGYSIDKEFRTLGVDYFPEEQLSFKEMSECVKCYEDEKPDFVLSHEGPYIALKDFPTDALTLYGLPKNWNSSTAHLLQCLWEYHKPKLWVFCHMHRWMDETIDGTRFICIPDRKYIEVDESLEVFKN